MLRISGQLVATNAGSQKFKKIELGFK